MIRIHPHIPQALQTVKEYDPPNTSTPGRRYSMVQPIQQYCRNVTLNIRCTRRVVFFLSAQRRLRGTLRGTSISLGPILYDCHTVAAKQDSWSDTARPPWALYLQQ